MPRVVEAFLTLHSLYFDIIRVRSHSGSGSQKIACDLRLDIWFIYYKGKYYKRCSIVFDIHKCILDTRDWLELWSNFVRLEAFTTE